MSDLETRVKAKLRDVADFPRPGVLFKDITPLLADASLYREVLDWIAEQIGSVDKIVAVESRGFLFAAPLVDRLGTGLILARKKGKLPWNTVSESFELEYGEAVLELHTDSLKPGDRVAIVDDLLATGGTARAAVDLVRKLGGIVVDVVVVTELGFLDGRDRFDCPVKSLVRF